MILVSGILDVDFLSSLVWRSMWNRCLLLLFKLLCLEKHVELLFIVIV